MDTVIAGEGVSCGSGLDGIVTTIGTDFSLHGLNADGGTGPFARCDKSPLDPVVRLPCVGLAGRGDPLVRVGTGDGDDDDDCSHRATRSVTSPAGLNGGSLLGTGGPRSLGLSSRLRASHASLIRFASVSSPSPVCSFTTFSSRSTVHRLSRSRSCSLKGNGSAGISPRARRAASREAGETNELGSVLGCGALGSDGSRSAVLRFCSAGLSCCVVGERSFDVNRLNRPGCVEPLPGSGGSSSSRDFRSFEGLLIVGPGTLEDGEKAISVSMEENEERGRYMNAGDTSESDTRYDPREACQGEVKWSGLQRG